MILWDNEIEPAQYSRHIGRIVDGQVNNLDTAFGWPCCRCRLPCLRFSLIVGVFSHPLNSVHVEFNVDMMQYRCDDDTNIRARKLVEIRFETKEVTYLSADMLLAKQLGWKDEIIHTLYTATRNLTQTQLQTRQCLRDRQ